ELERERAGALAQQILEPLSPGGPRAARTQRALGVQDRIGVAEEKLQRARLAHAVDRSGRVVEVLDRAVHERRTRALEPRAAAPAEQRRAGAGAGEDQIAPDQARAVGEPVGEARR